MTDQAPVHASMKTTWTRIKKGQESKNNQGRGKRKGCRFTITTTTRKRKNRAAFAHIKDSSDSIRDYCLIASP
jgi:hypothetical protein